VAASSVSSSVDAMSTPIVPSAAANGDSTTVDRKSAIDATPSIESIA
jgi:hypothetical protein